MPASRPSDLAHRALLEERARYMRFHPSPPEALFWRIASGKRLGLAFKRQVVVDDRYIVDFLAPSARLIVEIDGAQHRRTADAARDARRDRRLAFLGYRVVRITAEEMRGDLRVVVRRVLEAVG